ncbi:MAG: FIG00458265: hypothetical protein [uncultured Paraburkholderia sp.]|nr:MAG: FIG00458265: hypothetical protein [uncultured Paraburkholderia sp.]CAH2933209.1 MAG: FIG00458265: hypothetical protein [uncultured Paraburkholderia sp.]
MLLSDEELARLDGVAPFLESEAKTSLNFAPNYEVTAEFETHLNRDCASVPQRRTRHRRTQKRRRIR